jgi:hypothetical protein
MQGQFSFVQNTFNQIEQTISPERLARYLPDALGDKQLALRLYLWNARISETFYFPIQTAEVAVRNAIKKPLEKKYGNQWYKEGKFTNLLSDYKKNELSKVIRLETGKRGEAVLTQNHIVAGLSFGFWVGLMASAFKNHIWVNGINQSFPNAKAEDDQKSIFNKLEKMRCFRNQIMHHYAIFDKKPQTEYQNILAISKLICDDTHWLIKRCSNVGQTLNKRPTA